MKIKNQMLLLIFTIPVYNGVVLWLALSGGIHGRAGLAVGIIGSLLISLLIYRWLTKTITTVNKEVASASEEGAKTERIRSEFVANVTHELKTPLTSIMGFIETLQSGAADNPEIRNKFLDIISIETARLSRLIEDLLILSDIENKKSRTDTQDFNVKEVTQGTVAAVWPVAESKNMAISVQIDEDFTLSGSEDRFKQMMINLIENAIKYSENGKNIYIYSGEEGGRKTLCVRDEGIGIDREHQSRLFERFYRVDQSRTTKEGGTGLGLSIVKHISNLFGATVEVESEKGQGAIFKIVFPLDKNRK